MALWKSSPLNQHVGPLPGLCVGEEGAVVRGGFARPAWVAPPAPGMQTGAAGGPRRVLPVRGTAATAATPSTYLQATAPLPPLLRCKEGVRSPR